MTVREVERQVAHWARIPPPALALARLSIWAGLPAPEDVAPVAPVEASSLEELRAMGDSLGLGGTPPWERR